jgi:hypothetical protein
MRGVLPERETVCMARTRRRSHTDEAQRRIGTIAKSMNRTCTSLLVLALAAMSAGTDGFAMQEPSAQPQKRKPLVQETIAFHVIGLMKTKSGAT